MYDPTPKSLKLFNNYLNEYFRIKGNPFNIRERASHALFNRKAVVVLLTYTSNPKDKSELPHSIWFSDFRSSFTNYITLKGVQVSINLVKLPHKKIIVTLV